MLCVAGFVAMSDSLTHAQDFPSKPVRIITSAAGGGNDFMARLIATGLSGAIGQQVVVDNRGGGALPAVAVLQAPADGYTLLLSGSSFMIGHLLEESPFDPERDFQPVTLAGAAPNVVLVHPSLPVKTVKELIALAKARPGQLNYSSSAAGATQHLSAELFKAMAGVDIVRVPYKGAGPGLIALMGGETQVMISAASGAMPHIRSGKLKALAVTSLQPTQLAPGLPTVDASGLPGYEVISGDCVFVRVKTPPAIISRLNQEIVRVISRPEVKEKVFAAGAEVVASSPEALAANLKSEIAKWGKVIKDANIRTK